MLVIVKPTTTAADTDISIMLYGGVKAIPHSSLSAQHMGHMEVIASLIGLLCLASTQEDCSAVPPIPLRCDNMTTIKRIHQNPNAEVSLSHYGDKDHDLWQLIHIILHSLVPPSAASSFEDIFLLTFKPS